MNPTKLSITMLPLLLAVLPLLAVSQTVTCPCTLNSSPSCSSIALTVPDHCAAVTVPCGGCVCDANGPLTCVVNSQLSYQFNGSTDAQGRLCELRNTDVATCPGGPVPPEPTPTPPEPTATPPEPTPTPVPTPSQPEVVRRECCYGAENDFTTTCNFGGPPVGEISALTYSSWVNATGFFNISSAPPSATQAQFGVTVFTFYSDPSLQLFPLTTGAALVNELVTPADRFRVIEVPSNFNDEITVTEGEIFDYLTSGSSFTVTTSVSLGDSLGGTSRAAQTNACLYIDYTVQPEL